MRNPDFSDMLSALSAENAEFLVVIKNKNAIGRPQYLADVAELERPGWDS